MNNRLNKEIELEIISAFFLPKSEKPACIGESRICINKKESKNIVETACVC